MNRFGNIFFKQLNIGSINKTKGGSVIGRKEISIELAIFFIAGAAFFLAGDSNTPKRWILGLSIKTPFDGLMKFDGCSKEYIDAHFRF